jgi:predicted outer membrane repeat protein
MERNKLAINHKSRYSNGNLLIFVLVFMGLVFIFSYGMGNVAAANTIYVNGSSGNDSWTGLNSTHISGTLNGPKASIFGGVNAVTSGGTLKIANGFYTGSNNNNNISIDKNMIIKGQNSYNTIIKVSPDSYVFYINSNIKLNIDNLTIIDGYTTSSDGTIINEGNLIISSCIFTGNKSPNSVGGAIYNGNTGNLNVSDSTFTDNSAYNGGAIQNDGNLVVTGSTFTDNSASDGGAILNDGTATITGSNFNSNTADNNGGAIQNVGKLVITSSNFTGNYATNAGGAIENHLKGNSLTVSNSNFNDNIAGNSADYGGGAIYTDDAGNLSVTNSTFIENSANFGGAIYNTGKTLDLTGCTFTGNYATFNDGGAIYASSTSLIKSSNFNANSATDGGVIYNAGIMTVTSSNFNSNSASIMGGAICNGIVFNLNATGNTFISNSAHFGGAIYNLGFANINFNRIVGNTATTGSAIYNIGGAVNATSNGWGSNNGPSKGTVYGAVTVSPWMVTPTVKTISPKGGAGNIPTNQVITITFSESIKSNSMWIVLQNSKGTSIAIKTSISGNTLTIKPTSALSKGTKYTVLLHTGCVTDLAGDPLSGYTSTFTTA